MAIATPHTHPYSDPAAVDQLLEKVAAKVRAQLAQLDEAVLPQSGDAELGDAQGTGFKEAGFEGASLADVSVEDPSTKDFSAEAAGFQIVESSHSDFAGHSDFARYSDFENLEATASSDFELLSAARTDSSEIADGQLLVGAFAGVNIRQQAAEGYFQAIAYWLNERLVPQNIYAQVMADEVPGRLRVLIEFERAPKADRLVRLVCDRLYKLNSEVIEGVHIIVRSLGSAKTEWEKSVRIPTASERLRRVQLAGQLAGQSAVQPAVQSAAGVPKLVHESSHTQQARQVVQGQFKFLRAALVCGSAIAAFFFGSIAEMISSNRLSVASLNTDSAEDVEPWYGKAAELDFSAATEVSFRPASRFKGRTVEAALETVAVIPHNQVVDPADATVTLLFGGDLSLNDFVFEQASDVDQLFSNIAIYQQADVAMVGLAEPLAYASTSLQEDFYQRTRPQAVKALEAGGIDIVGLASEGTMAYGERGLKETLDNLDRQGIYRVGAGRNQQEAHRPEILEVKGQRIAYFGYNPDALKGADVDKAGVALASSDTRQHIAEDIRAIRSQVDWVVVNYRWGDAKEASEADSELSSEAAEEAAEGSADSSAAKSKSVLTGAVPKDWQRSLAHEAVDAGADLVVGYHPSLIQGTEIYRDRAIAYSLGDFAFDSTSTQKHDTAALKVSLRNQQMKVEFLPLTIQDDKLQMATGEHGAEILQTIRKASHTLSKPLRFPAVLKATPKPVPAAPANSVGSPQPTLESITEPITEPAIDPTIEQPAGREFSEPVSWPTEPAGFTQPKMTEPNISPTVSPFINPSDSVSPLDRSSAPATDPMMQESEALFMYKAAKEAVDPSLNLSPSETPLEAWGEKPTGSDLKFTPIPEGLLERQSSENESESSSEESLENGVLAPSLEDQSLENYGSENTTQENTTQESSTLENSRVEADLENELDTNSFEPWKDPFSEDESSEDLASENRVSEDSPSEDLPPEGLSFENSAFEDSSSTDSSSLDPSFANAPSESEPSEGSRSEDSRSKNSVQNYTENTD